MRAPRNRLKIFAVILLFFVAPGYAQAVSKAEVSRVLMRLEKAYGGNALKNLKTVTIQRDRRLAWMGQSQTADFNEFAVYRLASHFDLTLKHGSQESWIKQNGNIYHDRTIVNDQGAKRADYFEKIYTENADVTFFQIFSASYRLSDTLLAHYLVHENPDVQYRPAEFYQGETHDLLAFRITADGPEGTIYVSQSDGLIKRLKMERGIGMVNILFDAHTKKDGVTYASENRLYVDDALIEYDQTMKFLPNDNVKHHMVLEDDISANRPRVDMSAMTIDKLAPGVFHVGKDDYSLFVEYDNALIAVNAYAGLKERYEALTATGLNLPLKYVIVTHHHSDHMEAVGEAAELGATVMVTSEAQKVLKKDPDNDASPLSLKVMQDGEVLGPLTLYIKATNHAAQNAFIYHRDAKVLYQDDHYNGAFETGPTWVQPTALMMHGIIENLDIDVDRLLSGHSRKAETWADFQEGTRRTFPNNYCPTRREICRDKISD